VRVTTVKYNLFTVYGRTHNLHLVYTTSSISWNVNIWQLLIACSLSLSLSLSHYRTSFFHWSLFVVSRDIHPFIYGEVASLTIVSLNSNDLNRFIDIYEYICPMATLEWLDFVTMLSSRPLVTGCSCHVAVVNTVPTLHWFQRSSI